MAHAPRGFNGLPEFVYVLVEIALAAVALVSA